MTHLRPTTVVISTIAVGVIAVSGGVAAQTAFAPCSSATAASCRRIAATERACIPASPSPPGKTAADGWFCTTDHSGSLARSRSERPCHCP